MFDVFDILIPKISTTPRFEMRQIETAFGNAEDRFLYVDGIKFAKAVAAGVAYRDVKARAVSSSRENWTVLLAADSAYTAVANDGAWAQFLGSLVLILSANAGWRLTCESDCDQYPLETLALSAEEVAARLDNHRRTNSRPISFQVMSHQCP